jgi:hypothetical protein
MTSEHDINAGSNSIAYAIISICARRQIGSPTEFGGNQATRPLYVYANWIFFCEKNPKYRTLGANYE